MEKTVVANGIGLFGFLIRKEKAVSGLCRVCVVGKRKVTKNFCSGKLKYHEEVCFVFII